MISFKKSAACVLFIFSCLIFSAAFSSSVSKKFTDLERQFSGNLGVYAVDLGNDQQIVFKAKQRFPMCSTSKLMTVAAILKKSMNDPGFLKQRIKYTQQALTASGYAPETKKHLTTGMTIGELCKAAITQSDNAAANLLIQKLGGSKAVTAFARSIGDNSFRLDRLEPALNSAVPGDVRDTTTPMAMVKSVQSLVLGNVLAAQQRQLLITWLRENITGATSIRAVLPKSWLVGDKTGSGFYGTTNDVAIIWPASCSPIVMAIYFTQREKDATHQSRVVALAARIVLDELALDNACIRKTLGASA